MTSHRDGITPTERYLTLLARRSFLRLWSYSGLYRDQGVTQKGEGAELCDLLVVFDRDVLIFSDKDCAFPTIDDVDLAWRRWYRRAIAKSAQQVWGAERWLRSHPKRVFLDRACRERLPLELPAPEEATYHRIVVAHDTTGRRRELIGGSGSLLVDPAIVGDDHGRPEADGGRPFTVGQLDPARGFVHVFDDASLAIVLRTLDTITDFVRYLRRKEAFMTSGRLFGAYGEEDLLAYYLKHTNDGGEHDFVVPPQATQILLEEGQWNDYRRRDGVWRKHFADRDSYLWDEIIEDVAKHALAGTLLHTNHPGVSHQEKLLRVLAREPRLRRRMLARALRDRVAAPPPPGQASFRTVLPSDSGDPYYVIVVLSPPSDVTVRPNGWERYRVVRRELVASYATAAMEHFADAPRVVGIATEGGVGQGRSHDLVMIERDAWDAEFAADAKLLIAEHGWFRELALSRGVEDEYPDGPPTVGRAFSRKTNRVGRNDPCPCGSTKKFKKCHGAPSRVPPGPRRR